ncbi:MAG: hypothetical protein V2A65_04090 [Candidatus Omnitrophota bacterium]
MPVWFLCLLFLFPSVLFPEGIKVYPDPFDTKTIVETVGQKIVFDRTDTAKIVGWRFNNREYILYPDKGHGIAKDTLWSPRRLTLSVPYKLIKKGIKGGTVTLEFEGKFEVFPFQIGSSTSEGWTIIKTYYIQGSKPEITINYTIKNSGKKPRYFSFWFHNWLDFGSEYALILPGTKEIIIQLLTLPPEKENLVFPVENAPYTHGNEKFEKEYRLAETIKEGNFILYSKKTKTAFFVKPTYEKLLQEYTNISVNEIPTLEFMCQPYVLNPGKTWQMKAVVSFEENVSEEDLPGRVAKVIP